MWAAYAPAQGTQQAVPASGPLHFPILGSKAQQQGMEAQSSTNFLDITNGMSERPLQRGLVPPSPAPLISNLPPSQ